MRSAAIPRLKLFHLICGLSPRSYRRLALYAQDLQRADRLVAARRAHQRPGAVRRLTSHPVAQALAQSALAALWACQLA